MNMAENSQNPIPRVVKGHIAGKISIKGGVWEVGSLGWTGPQDPVRYRDLVNNPYKYVRDVSKYFGIEVDLNRFTPNDHGMSINRDFVKDPFASSSNSELSSKEFPLMSYEDTKKRLEVIPEPTYPWPDDPDYEVDAEDYEHWFATYGQVRPWFSGNMNFKDYAPLRECHYRIGYKHKDGNRLSRKLKYFLTCEELQYVIDKDLISGVSGYDVSTMGNLELAQFGPYMFQARLTGDRSDNYLYVTGDMHSDPAVITGSITGYHGSDDTNAVYNLRFNTTGQIPYQFWAYGMDLFPGTDYKIIFESSSYCIQDGSNKGPAGHMYQMVRDVPADENWFHRGVFSSGTPGVITQPTRIQIQEQYDGLEYYFNKSVDANNTEEVVYIAVAKPKKVNEVVFSSIMSMDHSYPLHTFYASGNQGDLDENGVDNSFSEENYWYVGAPSGYLGNRFQQYRNVNILDNDTIIGMRIPNQNYLINQRALREIKISGCKNFTDLVLPQALTSDIEQLKIVNCGLNVWNGVHRYHDDFDKTTFPYGLQREVPSGLRSPFYFGEDLDSKSEYFFNRGLLPVPIASNQFVHCNLSGNALNQTGCWHFIQACILSNSTYGYLNLAGQKYYNGPEDAVFYSMRPDMYEGQVEYDVEIPDINNACVSGIATLMDRQWHVVVDTHRKPHVHYTPHLTDYDGPYGNQIDGYPEGYLGTDDSDFYTDETVWTEFVDADESGEGDEWITDPWGYFTPGRTYPVDEDY